MQNRLYRSQKNKMIGGVAGGLGDYLNIDPVLIRIIFVITLFLSGTGFLLYVILWIVVPQEKITDDAGNFVETDKQAPNINGTAYSENTQTIQSKGTGRVIAGLLLIGIGILFLVDRFFPHFDFSDILPFLVIVLGVALILNSVKKPGGNHEN